MLAATLCVLLYVAIYENVSLSAFLHPPPPCNLYNCCGGGGSCIGSVPPSPAFMAKEAKSYRLWRRAAVEIDNGQYRQAEADARQCLALGRDPLMAQKFLAEALDGEGKTAEALQAYHALRTHDAHDLLRRSLLLLRVGRWAQAVDVYEDALPSVGEPFIGADAALQSACGHFSPAVHRAAHPRGNAKPAAEKRLR